MAVKCSWEWLKKHPVPVRFAISLRHFDVLLTVWMMHAGIVYCKPFLTNSSHGRVSIVLIVGLREFTFPCIIPSSSFASKAPQSATPLIKTSVFAARILMVWRERHFSVMFPCAATLPYVGRQLKLWSLKAKCCFKEEKPAEIFRKIPNLKGECLCVFSLLWIGCLTRSR